MLVALICGYTFIPTITGFFESKKLLAFSVSSYLSVCLLLFTCAVFTNGFSWLLTACIGVLIGYVLLFVPIFLAKSALSRYKFVISFAISWGFTILMLLNIHFWHPMMLMSALGITCYAFVPAVLCTVICALRLDRFLKTGICIAATTVIYYFADYAVDALFGIKQSTYQVNFYDWGQCLEGNIYLIALVSLLLLSAVFGGIGIYRVCKKR